MMTVSLPLYLLLLANAALIVAGVFSVMRVERALAESAEFWKSPTGSALRNDNGIPDVERVCAAVAVLQRSVDELREQAPASEPITDRPVAHAVQMAQRGASVTDITASCGLNIGEAELLHRLHGRTVSQMPKPPGVTPVARSA